MKIDGDNIIFTSGKSISCNCGIIGIGPNLDVSEGYDGGFTEPDNEFCPDFSEADAVELADYAISLWTKYREKWSPPNTGHHDGAAPAPSVDGVVQSLNSGGIK